jgi:hypothetical protein
MYVYQLLAKSFFFIDWSRNDWFYQVSLKSQENIDGTIDKNTPVIKNN